MEDTPVESSFEVPVSLPVAERVKRFINEQRLIGNRKCDRCLLLTWHQAFGSDLSVNHPLTYDTALDYIELLPCSCKRKVGNGAPSGLFAFTITKSPKDPFSIGDMLTAVRKVMSQKSCPVARYAWYYEDKGRDENGDAIHPHIHGIYETHTGGRIERKHWRRAWSIWDETKPLGKGFQGGYHRPVKAEEGYKDYIKKDGRMSESFGMDDQTE